MIDQALRLRENCGVGVGERLSGRYERYAGGLGIDAEVSPEGLPARVLFEAVNSGADFATLDQVYRTLERMRDGSSAIEFESRALRKALYSKLEGLWRHEDFDFVKMLTRGQRGDGDDTVTAVRRGFKLAPGRNNVEASLRSIKERARFIEISAGPEAVRILRDVVGNFQFLDSESELWLTTLDVLMAFTTSEDRDLGPELLSDTRVHVVKELHEGGLLGSGPSGSLA